MFSLWAHMITLIKVAFGFDPLASMILIVVIAVLGYYVGRAFVLRWNKTRSA